MTNIDDRGLLARFAGIMNKAFPDADIDEATELYSCSYGDAGFWAQPEEDGSLTIEVSYPFPVISPSELPDDWWYFEMQFTSERLEQAVIKTLLSSGHGWQRFYDAYAECPADNGGARIVLTDDTFDQSINQIVEDLNNYLKLAQKQIIKEDAAQAWFVAKCVQLGFSHESLDRPLEDLLGDFVVLSNDMLAGPNESLLPSDYRSDSFVRLTKNQIVAGERFYFVENYGKYFAFDIFFISLARRILLFSIDIMKQISKKYEFKHEINEDGVLRIQLKTQEGFNPWFLIIPYNIASARALESREPLITQRTGLLRTVLGESKVPKIEFSGMSDDEFEVFCCNLLIYLGATEIERRGSSRSRDSRVDILCRFERKDIIGKRIIKILVQSKRIKKSFGMADIDKLHFHELLRVNDADEFIIMCSSEPTKDVLELAHASEGKLQIMGNSRLCEEAAKYPELLMKIGEKHNLNRSD